MPLAWKTPFLVRSFLLGCAILLGMSSCRQENVDKHISDWEFQEPITFAGDTIPLTDPEIREKLEKELWINAYWHSNTAQLIRRSGRWFPLLDSLLEREGVPNDFRYLVAIESSFENVTSNKGAVGFWQLMEPTARELGLKMNAEIDERLYPEKATVAACQYLKKAKSQLGSWTSVAASYNIGVQGLKNVMALQYTDQLYDVLINSETGRYLFRAVACKLILEHPEKFGFQQLKAIHKPTYTEEKITQSVGDLAYWSRKKGFSYKCFRQLNPWIKGNSLTISDTIPFYQVYLPTDCRVYTQMALPEKEAPDSVKEKLDLVLRHTINEKNMAGLKLESNQPKEDQLPEYHIISSGDNLETIARKYQMKKEDLIRLNPEISKNQNHIQKGMRLRLR